jgi:hypothetical protein
MAGPPRNPTAATPTAASRETATRETAGRPGRRPAAGGGASPQVSQYPSWIVPPQPARVHVVAAVVVMAAAPVS